VDLIDCSSGGSVPHAEIPAGERLIILTNPFPGRSNI
jgi:hypothetical protein